MSSKRRSKLPNVGDLRTQLGYGDPALERSKSFCDYCRYFTKNYVGTDGVAGSQFYDRNRRDHLVGIQEMTTAFLDTEGKGNVWWPSDPNHRNANTLQYSTHHRFIRQRLALLLLKINHQAHQNTRYKSKHGANSLQTEPASESQRSSRNDSAAGLSVSDPIDLENEYHSAHFASIDNQPAAENQKTAASKTQQSNTDALVNAPTREAEAACREELSLQKAPTADVYAIPETPEPRQNPITATNEPSDGSMAAPATASNPNAGGSPCARSGAKRPTAGDTRSPSKRQKATSNADGHSNSRPEQTPQRKSNRKRFSRYEHLDFTLDSPTETADEETGQAIWANGEETGLEAAQVAPAVVPSVPSAIAVELGPDIAASVPDAVSEPTPLPSASLGPASSEVADKREEEAGRAHLERQIELERARREKASEMPLKGPLAILPANHEDNTPPPSIDPILFSRVSAVHDLGTPEERCGYIVEDFGHRSRVPEAPMAFMLSDESEQIAFPRSRISPPPPDMGSHDWAASANTMLKSTESVRQTAERASDPGVASQRKTLSPDLTSSRVTPQLSTVLDQDQRNTAKNAVDAPQKQESMARESDRSSTGPPLQTSSKPEPRLIVISGPRKQRIQWRPKERFQDLTLAKIKATIPLQLSPDFRGFKFTVIGAGQRACWEVLDGDEFELEHVKLDVEDAIEDWQEKQSTGRCLAVQIRLQELRDAEAKEEVAEPMA